ncbi:MAG: HAD family phosphatase [Bacteriovorax sp.]|jgi:beta-phosphoglucomutase|nr:HAD family phosphatase [Bacteriovorax sp.]
MTDLKDLLNAHETVIFDMDGTIVNTEPLHAKAAVIVLQSRGYDIDLEACLDQFYGMTDTAVLKITCPELNEGQIQEAIEEKNKHLLNIFLKLSEEEKSQYITPGLFDFLRTLRKEKKSIAVISASEDIIVEKTLECFAIDTFVDLQMGRNQTILTKPHPDPYLEGMKRLNALPHKTLIFEDSPTGLQSAIASGANVIRIIGFAHNQDVLHTKEIKNFHF